MRKISRTPQRLQQTLKRADPDAMRARMKRRPALAFVQREPNPLLGMEKDLPAEEAFAETAKRLEGGLSAAMQKQMQAFAGQGRSDYYAVLCFEQGEQLEALLKAWGYPDPEAAFIDGPLLASILGIEIPEPEFRLKPLRGVDKALARLVTHVPKGLSSGP